MGSVKTGAQRKIQCVRNPLARNDNLPGHAYEKMLCIIGAVPRYAGHKAGHFCPGRSANDINDLSYASENRGTSRGTSKTYRGTRGTPFRGSAPGCPGPILSVK